MNYLKHYIKLCRNCQHIQKSKIYTERHHVFPVSLYGKNKFIVRMSAKQHFIAHFLLWKICKKRYGLHHPKTIKMGYAFYKMTITSVSSQQRYTSRSHSIAKEWYSKNNPSKYRDISGDKNPMFGKNAELHHLFGIPCSEERKKKIGEANKGKLSGDKNPSKRQDVRDKISNSWKLNPNRKIRKGKESSNYNHQLTDIIRQLLKEEWNNVKSNESLYSFAKRNALLYNVSMGGIQSIVYISPKKQLTSSAYV